MLHRRAILSLVGGGTVAAGLGGIATPRRAFAEAPSALPRAGRPEEVGLSAERLGRISNWFRTEVEAGRIPGAVVTVGRKGKIVHHEAIGFRDREARAPMGTHWAPSSAVIDKPTRAALCRCGSPRSLHRRTASCQAASETSSSSPR